MTSLLAILRSADRVLFPRHVGPTSRFTFWFKPGGPGVTTKGRSTIRSLFDGLCVEEKIEAVRNGVPFTTLAWTGFNTATHQYGATRIASTNAIRIAETGSCDEKRFRFLAR